MTDHQHDDWKREIYERCDKEDEAEMKKELLGYDIDKVSPGPWRIIERKAILSDGEVFIEYYIADASGKVISVFPSHKSDNRDRDEHIVHCVNLEATLRSRVEKLIKEEREYRDRKVSMGINTADAIASRERERAYNQILALLDGEPEETKDESDS